MKSSVNKLIIMVWCFCMGSMVIANDQIDPKKGPALKRIDKTEILPAQGEPIGDLYGEIPTFIVEEGVRVATELCVDTDYYYYEIEWVIQDSDGALQGPWVSPTTSSTECTTMDLDPGTYSFYLMDDYGDGSVTLYVNGTSLGYYYLSSATYMNGDYYMSSDPFVISTPSCDDTTACNYQSTTDKCTYAADA